MPNISIRLPRLTILICTILTVLLARGDEQKPTSFPHLLGQTDASRPRVHAISEVVQSDHKVQVEEYVDLATHNQLIQLKWHTGQTPSGDSKQQLKTHKLNVLLLNGEDKRVMYQYKPYECSSILLDGQDHFDGNGALWKALDESSGQAGSTSDEQAVATLAKSIVSTARDSPYLARTENGAIIGGIAGLWLAAQFGAEKPRRLDPQEDGVWRLERSGKLVVDYFMSQQVRRVASERYEFEAPELIIIKPSDVSADEPRSQQTINVFKLELDFSDTLARNLFALPIGFDCPANPMLSTRGLYLGASAPSQLMEFELVASREPAAADSGARPLVEVRNIELAQVAHPMKPSARLVMLGSREDRYKEIQDHGYQLAYKLFHPAAASDGSGSAHVQCLVEHLEYGQQDKAAATASLNTNQIRFNANKLQLDLSEFHLNFLLGLSPYLGDDKPNNGSSVQQLEHMRLLSSIEPSGEAQRSELVFESRVPPEHSQMLIDLAGEHESFEMRCVRVYERVASRTKALDGSQQASGTKSRQAQGGFLKLARVLLLVFDGAGRREKLAEVRFNLLEDRQILSYTRRAQLFDLTPCKRADEESMQLVVRYPADPSLLDFVDEHSSELLERFYRAASDWISMAPASSNKLPVDANGEAGPEMGPSSMEETGDAELALQKRRLGASLNYLRVPRLELRRSLGGDLELHLTILDKVSPLDSYERISGATFGIEEDDNCDEGGQPLLVGSVRECARLCQLFGCKIFAYDDSSRQCRMSHLRLRADEAPGTSQESSSVASEGPSGDEKRARIVRLPTKPFVELHYEAEHQDWPIAEVTLAELNSYIEHISSELERFSALEDEENDADGDALTTRQKRQAAPEQLPLFAFDFVDRSGSAGEYAAPKMRLLVPSGLGARRVPLVLSVARDGQQMARIARSFSVKHVGKAYKLSALDKDRSLRRAATGERSDDERLFRDSANEAYYTLRQVASISQDNCALLCHNSEEWDWRTSSEETCVSFSYSQPEERCVLVIKTDFKFISSGGGADELASQAPLELNSLEQLMSDSFGAIVAFRNYLPNFEGPLRIPELVSGSRATDALREAALGGQLEGLELEWLPAITVEYGEGDTEQGDIREQCAQKCSGEFNRAGALCLALDHCASARMHKQWAQEGGWPVAGPPTESVLRHTQTCQLLLIRNKQTLVAERENLDKIRWLRGHLASQAKGEHNLSGGGSGGSNQTTPGATCNRYILSHLYEFNQLSQRQVRASNEMVRRKLEGSRAEGSLDGGTNLDACALECSMRTPINCLMFEFCQSVGQLDGPSSGHKSSLVERSCTLFRRVDFGVSSAGGGGGDTAKGENQLDESQANANNSAPTSYHKDCHVYVRREFSSIEQALSDSALEKLAKMSPLREFTHTLLTIAFSALYISVLATGLVCLLSAWRKRRTTATRADAAIMMSEINSRLARA